MLYPYPGYCETGRTDPTEVPGTGMKYYRTPRSCGYGYESLTERPEVSVIVAEAHITYRSSGQV